MRMPLKPSPLSTPRARQRGATLLVALMMLVILAVLGITAIGTSTLEERMAGGAIDRKVAFEAAEAGLRDAERYVMNSVSPTMGFDAACTNGRCLPSTVVAQVWETMNWMSGTPIVYGALTGAPDLAGVTRQPRYVVELFADVPAAVGAGMAMGSKPSGGMAGTAYRITAVGWGKYPGTQVMLQSIFVKT